MRDLLKTIPNKGVRGKILEHIIVLQGPQDVSLPPFMGYAHKKKGIQRRRLNPPEVIHDGMKTWVNTKTSLNLQIQQQHFR